MRVSVDQTSPYFRCDFMHLAVHVDGLELHNVVEASEEEGWVDCIVGYEEDRPRYERLTGMVRVTQMPDA